MSLLNYSRNKSTHFSNTGSPVLNYGDCKYFSNMTFIQYYSPEDYIFKNQRHFIDKASFKAKTVPNFRKFTH